MQRLGPERRLETGHDQGGTNSFPANISNCDAPSSALQKEKIVIVTANLMSRLVERLARHAGNGQALGREECLLNILGARQVSAHGPAESRIRFGFFQMLQMTLQMIPQ